LDGATIYLFKVDKITDFGASECAVSQCSCYSIVLIPTHSLFPPLLECRRSLTLTWREIELATKIKQIKIEFLCLIFLDDRTKRLTPNDSNTSPNWSVGLVFAEIFVGVSFLFVLLQPH
jgi:hypothetical protein